MILTTNQANSIINEFKELRQSNSTIIHIWSTEENYLWLIRDHLYQWYGAHFTYTELTWMLEFEDPKLETIFLLKHPG